MGDNEPTQTDSAQQEQTPVRGFSALKIHVIEHKIDVALWATRVFTVLFTLGYFIPLFGNPNNAYYKALIANAATSALRLHQRIPRVTFSREFVTTLLREDSCHYLFYSLIFLYVAPVTLALVPVTLFAILHSASYSLTLLDSLGQNSWWGARLMISLVEFQSRNILRLVAFTEIILMPFTVILILLAYAHASFNAGLLLEKATSNLIKFYYKYLAMPYQGRAGLLTPFIYYHFLTLRYSSIRNPYTRNMFMELRMVVESTANKPGMPGFLRNALLSVVNLASRLAPQPQPQQ